MYLALTQTNPDIATPTLSNYQRYVKAAKACKTIVDEDGNVKKGSTFWSQVSFDDFVLPAQGQAKPYCKKWISWGCDNTKQHPKGKHYAEHEQKTCKVAHCPRCFESWISRQANRSAKRFSTYVENKQYNFRHIVLSPPEEKAKNMSYDELKKGLQFALKVANIKTTAVVFHPFRFYDKEKVQPYVSPHFHLIVYGKITNTTEFYNKVGWYIGNKGNLKTDVDIFNCVRYALSHAGVRKKTHVIRYLGDISYRKLKVEKEPKNHFCPYCDLPLTVFFVRDSSKSLKPPIDHVGLWESSCFKIVEPTEHMKNIPFYELRRDTKGYHTKDKLDYWEDSIYSFEELLSIKSNLSIIQKAKRSYEIKQNEILDKSTDSQKLDDFVIC